MNKFYIRFLNKYNKYIHRFSVNENDASHKKVLVSIYVIFTLITISILVIFAIKPALSTVANLQQQLKDDQRVEQAMSTKLQSLRLLDLEYEQLTPNLPYLLEAIPQNAEIATVTRQLEKITLNNQLILTTLTINNFQLYPQTPSSVASFAFNISIQGSGDNINNFIQNISSFERLITIDSISKNKPDEKGTTQASVIGRVYYFNK